MLAHYRRYFKRAVAIWLLFSLVSTSFAQNKASEPAGDDGQKERLYCVQTLTRIADPVLNALSRNELRKLMPVEAKNVESASSSTHLEAFGRLLSGMAPWLELGPDDTPEGKLRKKYIDLALA